MESERFDRIAKLVAGNASRRAALRRLVASTVGSGLGLLAFGGLFDEEPARAKKNKNNKKGCNGNAQCKKPKNPCKKGVCKHGKCRKQNQPNGKSCGDGLQCQNGQCVCPDGTCVVTVRPSSMRGWQFFNDQADLPIDPTMEVGPDDPPQGVGSALLEIGGNPEGKLISATILTETPLADFERLEYSYCVTSSTAGTAPSLQLGIKFDLTGDEDGFQGRMVYVPSATGAVTNGEWITVDALADNGTGNWFFTCATPRPACAVTSGGTCPLSDPCDFSEILADFPNIGIHPIGAIGTGAGFGFIGMKVGSGEGAVDANVDAVTVKLAGADETTTVYNFEPDPQ